jgi:hypothetical protein
VVRPHFVRIALFFLSVTACLRERILPPANVTGAGDDASRDRRIGLQQSVGPGRDHTEPRRGAGETDDARDALAVPARSGRRDSRTVAAADAVA